MYDLDRQTKANTVIETLSAKERSRFDNAANTLRIALAKKHGEALHDISMARAVALAIFEPDMLEVVHSETILSKSQVNAVLGAVERDEIIQRNLTYSNEDLRKDTREQVLDDMPAHRRITMARTGDLEHYIAREVHDRLSDRSPV